MCSQIREKETKTSDTEITEEESVAIKKSKASKKTTKEWEKLERDAKEESFLPRRSRGGEENRSWRSLGRHRTPSLREEKRAREEEGEKKRGRKKRG